MKQLLREFQVLNYTPQLVAESREQNNGKIILRGKMQQADKLNQNGRVYAREILSREVRNYQKFILENRALGELDHPDTSVVNLKNASHIVRECKMEDDGSVMGAIELLDTPSGKIAQSLVESGVKLGISSRGVGGTRQVDGITTVDDTFLLVAFDLVSDPSTAGAFMTEGRKISDVEFRQVLNKSDRLDRILNEILG